jgi:hypothetical protein
VRADWAGGKRKQARPRREKGRRKERSPRLGRAEEKSEPAGLGRKEEKKGKKNKRSGPGPSRK